MNYNGNLMLLRMAVVKSGYMLEHLRISHYRFQWFDDKRAARKGDNVMSADHQQERLSVNERQKWFLAGFIEGEGSVCVSIKKHPTARCGYYVDPEFFLYQLDSAIENLYLAREVFDAGTIHPKPGNERVLVYSITSRRVIAEKVLPFLSKYMVFSAKREIYEKFSIIVEAMERNEHQTPQGMARLVKQAYEMNPAAKGKPRKRSLKEVTDRILRDCTPDIQNG